VLVVLVVDGFWFEDWSGDWSGDCFGDWFGDWFVSYPAEEDAAEAFLCHDGAPCLEVGRVELRIDLAAAFDEVERSDGGVSWAAGWEGG
jgi:hypothetical protein